MEVYPIIYSRNYNMDYSTRFYVCPKDIDDLILDRIQKYIVDVIKYPNMMSNYRRIVISEKGYTTCGFVCDLKDFVHSNFHDVEEYDKYTEDKKGRSVISFIGIIFKSIDLKKNYIISNFNSVINKVFEIYLANEDLWFNEGRNHYDSQPLEVELSEYEARNITGEKIECYGAKKIYTCSEENDEILFLKTLSLCGGDITNYHFCSDYYGIESIKDTKFFILTSKYIAKIKKFLTDEVKYQKDTFNTENLKFTQKKTQIATICGIVAIIIMIIIIIDARK